MPCLISKRRIDAPAERAWGLLAPLLVLLWLCGCPRPQVVFGPEGRLGDPQKLLDLVTRRGSQIFALKGEAKVKVSGPQGVGSASNFVALLRPGSMHFETLSFFGKPIAALVSDGQGFSFLDVEANTFYSGPATPAVAGRFLPLALSPAEAVALLLGSPARIAPEQAELGLDAREGAYRLVLRRGKVSQTLLVATDDYRVLKSEVEGIPAYDLEYRDFRDHGPLRFGHEIEVRSAAAKTRVTVRFGEVELNAAPDLTLFQLEAPPGAKVVRLDEQGRAVDAPPPAAP